LVAEGEKISGRRIDKYYELCYDIYMDAREDIPDKLTFKRKEVERITKLDGKVLDYWQQEFGGFSPSVNQVGEVFYSRKDIEFILKLKQWMIVEKIGKAGIKELLAGEIPGNEQPKAVSTENGLPVDREKLKIIRRNLQDILTILDKNDR
jgi:DNA-binding transcriptional MerR regulator